MEYREEPWIDPRVVVRASSAHGRGTFATAPIRAEEVIIIWGGTLFTAEEVWRGASRQFSYAPVEEGLYLGGPVGGPESQDDLMNHSCDPNVWLTDAVTLVARRGIKAGEELTIDYVTFNGSDWTVPWTCNCGWSLCHEKITGLDYRLSSLQNRYGEHWSPYINRKIAQERG